MSRGFNENRDPAFNGGLGLSQRSLVATWDLGSSDASGCLFCAADPEEWSRHSVSRRALRSRAAKTTRCESHSIVMHDVYQRGI